MRRQSNPLLASAAVEDLEHRRCTVPYCTQWDTIPHCDPAQPEGERLWLCRDHATRWGVWHLERPEEESWMDSLRAFCKTEGGRVPAWLRSSEDSDPRPPAHQSSHYRGVSSSSSPKNPWRARIYLGREENIHIGNFSTEEEAARAYDAKAKELLGEEAKLNFPEDD